MEKITTIQEKRNEKNRQCEWCDALVGCCDCEVVVTTSRGKLNALLEGLEDLCRSSTNERVKDDLEADAVLFLK
jgi:hypothetical protein